MAYKTRKGDRVCPEIPRKKDSLVVGGKLFCWGSILVKPNPTEPAIEIRNPGLAFDKEFDGKPYSVVISYNANTTGTVYATYNYEVTSKEISTLIGRSLPGDSTDVDRVEVNYLAIGLSK